MLLLLLLTLATDASASAPADQESEISFTRDIQPIFRAHCYRCHGPDAQKSGLRLDVKKALEGGDSGPLLIAGKSEESALLIRVTSREEGERMPPEGAPLTEAQISALRKWIDQGGKWPEVINAETRPHSTHWSFQAPTVADPPNVRDESWIRNPIDRFVLAPLEARGVVPSREADRSTLLRRLFLDLTGLPPTLEQRDEFLSDTAPGAYERLVDRLLGSAHFGERWGRHWLDAARYADSNGYERDDARPNAWRYRDWVIEAINRDLPFDRFVIEQLAGDLLPGATLDQQIATGFHRMTTKNTESGVNKEDYRNREIVDRVNTTASALLGLTVGCAQCHSHKYDPITQQEYYKLYGFFNNSEESDVAIEGTPDEIRIYQEALAAHEQKERRLTQRKRVLESIAKLGCDGWRRSVLEAAPEAERQLAAVVDVQSLGAERWSRELSPALLEALKPAADVRAALAVEESQRTEPQRKALTECFNALDSQKTSLKLQVRPLREHLDELEQSDEWVQAMLAAPTERTAEQSALLVEFEKALPARIDDLGQEIRLLGVEKRYLPKPAVMALAEGSQNRRSTHVLLRGDFKQKGSEVQPGVPAVLPPLQPRQDGADRLDLANWITEPANPLTSRVAVNQIWKQLFGRGLVASVDDFGTQGDRPSHPELLDWLAVQFRELGWSRKQLIRLIVTSATYRQSSHARPELESEDPLNTWLARQGRFRVEGEIVRDLFLAAGGLLHPAVGGRTVFPVVPESIREFAYKYKLVWQTSSKPDRYRRGMYIHFKRSNPYPSLITFDCPESTICTTARTRSNTPLQALVTLNDPVFVECAQALARRIADQSSEVGDRIRFAGRVCLARELSPIEVETLRELFESERQTYVGAPAAAAEFAGEANVAQRSPAEAAAWTSVARALMNLDEFVTRE